MVDYSSAGLVDIQSQNFVPTELPNAIDHFICKHCQYVVYQPKECPVCQFIYCNECVQQISRKEGKWRCQVCNTGEAVSDIHRVVKEVLEKLVFSCPKCKTTKRAYADIFKHFDECQGPSANVGPNIIDGTPIGQAQQVVQPLPKTFAQQVQIGAPQGLQIFIMEKDSKKFFIYNTMTQSVTQNVVQSPTNFPHNFQAIQVGSIDTRVFIVGGGDFSQLPDSMFQLQQIVSIPSQQGTFRLEQRSKMKFARHGHSVCAMADNFLVVTGSRKDIDGASKQTELYSVQADSWFTLAPFNTGRHYHSSCSFQNKSVYIFCGISNESKKYLSTIERIDIDPFNIQASQSNRWVQIQVNGLSNMTPRQGCGVCEIPGQQEILIVGGFHGQFSNETFFLNTSTNNLRKSLKDIQDNIFPFQVPTIADPASNAVITIDWQTYKLYEFKTDQWHFKKKLK